MERSEELQVRAGDLTLAGTLLLPDEPAPPDRRGRYPAVLLLPSWLPRDRDGAWDRVGHAAWFAPPVDGAAGLLARMANALAALGVASLRCDPRGCGASEGAWEATSLFTRIDDARDMLAAMRSHGSLDLRRTGIVGHGEAATLALSVAIGDPAVGALTLIGPSARSWRDVLRRGVAERTRTGVDRQHPIVRALDRWSEELIERAERREPSMHLPLRGADPLILDLAAIEQAIHTPPLALASMLHRSVGLVHGADDVWADPDESALLQAALVEGGNQPGRRVLAATGHDLAEASDEQIATLAADLAARLLPTELPPVLVAIEEMGDDVRYDGPMKPQPGEDAPDFSMTADDGATVSRQGLLGQRYILYFYPKDDTAGCTAQACSMRDNFGRVIGTGVQVFGVSPDPVKSHVKFRAKYELPYRLLSDDGHVVAEAFGVWVEKTYLGRSYQGVERSSFVIGPEGRVEHVLERVKPMEHVDLLMEALAA